MELALEVLRADRLVDALIVLEIVGDLGSPACAAAERAAEAARVERPYYRREQRLIRARLALFLRARLRADRGDCGLWRCTTCVTATLPTKNCPFCERDWSRGEQHRRITPLWERAPGARR